MGESVAIAISQTWVWIPVQPLASYVILDKYLNFSELSFWLLQES